MEALFDIFDFDNDGYFGIDDLITLLRTYEKLGIVPQLNKLKLSESPSASSDSSGRRTNVDSDSSSQSIETMPTSSELSEKLSERPVYFTSKQLHKIAKRMFGESGFDSTENLTLTDFTDFMDEHICFQNSFYHSMKCDLWMDNSTSVKRTKDSPNVIPVERKSKFYKSHKSPTRISKMSVHLPEPTLNEGENFFENRENADMHGYLRKKGRKSGNLRKRYYYIKGEIMYYFNNPKDVIPRGLMYMPNKLFKKEVVKGKHCIKVYTYESSYMHKCFYARNEEDCETWYQAMLRASNNLDVTKLYKMKETLGVGKFSTVRKAYLKTDETQNVAIKIVSKKSFDQNEREYILHELSILRTVTHPSIPRVIGVHETPEKMYVILQNIKDGELFDYLIEGGTLPADEATRIVYKLVKILKYLKELRIMHRDIKTENILISKNKRGLADKVYLIDFGLARYVDSRVPVSTKLGTLGYCAPEVILKENYNEKVDVWSTGMVYYLLLTGTLPFDSKNDSKIVEKTVKDELPLTNKVFDGIHPKIIKFLDKACKKDPKERMTIKECLLALSEISES